MITVQPEWVLLSLINETTIFVKQQNPNALSPFELHVYVDTICQQGLPAMVDSLMQPWEDTGRAADGDAGLPATFSSAGSISTLRTAGAMVELETQSNVDSKVDSSSQPSSQSKTSTAPGTVDESKFVSGHDGTMADRVLQLADRLPVPRASPYPAVPSFGAKTDGPLSAIMARTAGDGGRPDYDSLLSLRQPKKKKVLSAKPTTLQSLVEPSHADKPASQNQLNSPQKSHASTSSLRSTGASSTDEAATPSLCEPAQGGGKTCIIYGPASKEISLPTASRESVIAAIQNQLSIPVDEQHLLQEASSKPNVDVYRVERKMDPRRLKFTQATVSPNFRNGRPIFDLLNDLNSQQIDPLRELEPLDVVLYNGCWWSLSNRRLWALKHCTAALTHQPLHVRVRVRQPHAEFRHKCTTTNDGASVLIVQRARSPSPCAAKLAAAWLSSIFIPKRPYRFKFAVRIEQKWKYSTKRSYEPCQRARRLKHFNFKTCAAFRLQSARTEPGGPLRNSSSLWAVCFDKTLQTPKASPLICRLCEERQERERDPGNTLWLIVFLKVHGTITHEFEIIRARRRRISAVIQSLSIRVICSSVVVEEIFSLNIHCIFVPLQYLHLHAVKHVFT